MTPHHRYQILTKRADRLAEYYDGNWRERVSKIVNEWPEEQIFSGNEFLADIRLMREKFLRNVALGVSVENQLAEWRIEHLRYKIGRAHVRTPVTNAHLVCRLL